MAHKTSIITTAEKLGLTIFSVGNALWNVCEHWGWKYNHSLVAMLYNLTIEKKKTCRWVLKSNVRRIPNLNWLIFKLTMRPHFQWSWCQTAAAIMTRVQFDNTWKNHLGHWKTAAYFTQPAINCLILKNKNKNLQIKKWKVSYSPTEPTATVQEWNLTISDLVPVTRFLK